MLQTVTSRVRGCRKREVGQTSQQSHAEGLGGSPSKQLFPSPSLEPPLSLGCIWYAGHVCGILCVFFHHAEWLGGTGPISGVILLCGPEPLSHCPGLPSCLSSGPSLQCRMGDKLLITWPSACRAIRPTLSASKMWLPIKFKCPTDVCLSAVCLSAVFLANVSPPL